MIISLPQSFSSRGGGSIRCLRKTHGLSAIQETQASAPQQTQTKCSTIIFFFYGVYKHYILSMSQTELIYIYMYPVPFIGWSNRNSSGIQLKMSLSQFTEELTSKFRIVLSLFQSLKPHKITTQRVPRSIYDNAQTSVLPQFRTTHTSSDGVA